MRNIVENMPIAVSGTILAILSLGVLLNNRYIQYFCLVLATLLMVILVLKVLLYFDSVKRELDNPIVLGTSGTFSMALMFLSTYLAEISYQLSLILWILGVSLHSLLIVYYTYRYFIKEFNVKNFYGSLWVVYIGITMASISGGILNLEAFSWIFLLFGFVIMLPTITLVSFRYIKYPVEIDANKPLICIYTAIFNILTVGYFSTYEKVNTTVVLVLFIIACCFYVFSFYKLTQYINLPFYPSFSAFTFPFVISAIATTKVLSLSQDNIILVAIALIETIVAIILVCYVLYEYAINVVLN